MRQRRNEMARFPLSPTAMKTAIERHNHTDGEASVATALTHVIEAGQQVILDRIELARLDAREMLGRTLRASVFFATGTLFVVGGWAAIMAMAVILLDRALPLSASLALVGVLNGGIGAALFLRGGRAMNGGEEGTSSDEPTAQRAAEIR